MFLYQHIWINMEGSGVPVNAPIEILGLAGKAIDDTQQQAQIGPCAAPAAVATLKAVERPGENHQRCIELVGFTPQSLRVASCKRYGTCH